MQKRLKIKKIRKNRRLNRSSVKVAAANSFYGLREKLPVLAVRRSNRYIYAQLVKDGKTLFTVSDMKISKGTKTERAIEVGKNCADSAKKLKIEKVVFEKGDTIYHGRVKALADSARSNGLTI